FTGVFTPAVEPAAVWTFAVGPGASSASPGPVRELTQARGRVLTRRIGGHHFAQFSLSGSVGGSDPAAEEAAEIELRKSDLWVYRNGGLVHRGRLVSQQVQVNATRWVRTYQSIDYRGMLLHYARFKPPVPSWTNEDQAQIAWEMVEHRQAQTGGNWGITEGV